MSLTASVLGASGFTGGEVLRLLTGHPEIRTIVIGARSSAGQALEALQPHLPGGADLQTLESAAETPVDVCFSCLPAGALAEVLETVDAKIVVDLADDHRASDEWTYGLTEFARDAVTSARRIANPGCYPTATLLALVPFARAGVIDAPVVVDAMSGTSGAGRSIPDHLGFAQMHGNAGAYGTTTHRHVPEMERYLDAFGGLQATISFTPHLLPVARGLLATVRARTSDLTDEAARAILQDAYSNEPFVRVVDGWPSIKAVDGSNGALVSARVDERAGWLIASAAIDNLGKGAAGQALQNANLSLGLDEKLGLTSVGVWP